MGTGCGKETAGTDGALDRGLYPWTIDMAGARWTATDAFELVDTTASHIQRSLQVQRLLAASSQRGRKIRGLLIAAAAEELGASLLHYDADFDQIAAVTGQRCEWVVRAGAID